MEAHTEGRVALVTGAASGIGRATAVAFARMGARVVVADRDASGNEETAQMVCDAGAEVLAVTTDVASPGDVERMVQETERRFRGLDYACNNAGIEGTLMPTADYTVELWDRVMAVNLRGVWLCMKAEIPAMLRRGGGAIVNMASILGAVGFANAPAYTAAKHGVVGLSKAAALEYAKQGIRVNVIGPAFIATPMLERAGITTEPALREQVTALHPIGRMGTPEEVASAVVWLCSQGASFVTGHHLLVDGGYTAQ